MGKGAVAEQASKLAALNEQLGPVRRGGEYKHNGCPKCGADAKELKLVWCPGKNPKIAAGNCSLKGEHMHGHCTNCGWTWREETRDADEIGERASKAGTNA